MGLNDSYLLQSNVFTRQENPGKQLDRQKWQANAKNMSKLNQTIYTSAHFNQI